MQVYDGAQYESDMCARMCVCDAATHAAAELRRWKENSSML